MGGDHTIAGGGAIDTATRHHIYMCVYTHTYMYAGLCRKGLLASRLLSNLSKAPWVRNFDLSLSVDGLQMSHGHVENPVCAAIVAPVRGPKDHINIRILQTMISGIPLILSLGTRMSDRYVYVAFGPLYE